MEDCIFCKIVNGDIPCFKIYEDENYIAFLDISQFVPGHTLIVPKQHYKYIWDVEDIGEYFKFAKSIADHFQSLGYQYVDTLTLGRMIPHAHIHLVPHNNKGNDWEKALSGIGDLQDNESRKPTIEGLKEIHEEFKID